MLLYVFWCRLYQAVFRAVSPLLPWREPQLISGPGSIRSLPELMRREKLNHPLVVTDASLVRIGLTEELLGIFRAEQVPFTLYDETVVNPTVENIEKGAELYRSSGCGCLLAFGGGSPMDCAKGIGARIARPKKPLHRMRGVLKVRRRIPPLIAVVTTAGTGSETTLAAVISDPRTHEKYPVNDHVLIPRYAVHDPELTLGLPRSLTASTGMDALTHAVEAYIGRSCTRRTEADSIEAVSLILTYLPRAYEDGSNLQARERMLTAAYLAGRAFTRAYIGYVHAMAHTLGGFYGVPHGLANAVLLPHVLTRYGAAAERRLAALARKSGVAAENDTDAQASGKFIERIREMNRSMRIPEYLGEQIRDEDIPQLAAHAASEANPLYPVPRILSKRELAELFFTAADRSGSAGEA
jgi:alcohol dehydrogenase